MNILSVSTSSENVSPIAYCDLLNKFKSLQNEFQLMNEAKMRLEYELRQKSESANKNLDDLR